jgi:antitoxin VapB
MPPVASRGGSNSLAVTDELDRAKEAQPLQDSIQAWRDANPLPPPTGLKADEAFFDELSGEP